MLKVILIYRQEVISVNCKSIIIGMKNYIISIFTTFFLFFSQSIAIAQDLAVTVFISPNNACNLTASETVSVVILNNSNILPAFGGDYTLNYTVDGAGLVQENPGAPINPNATSSYTFTQNADLSVCGPHKIKVWIDHPSDGNQSNDTITWTVQNDCTVFPGEVSPDLTVCELDNKDTLKLINSQYGYISDWEYSENNGSTWISTGVSNTTYEFLNLTTETLFRVILDGGFCPDDTSAPVTVTVNSIPTIVVTGDTTICNGDSITLTASGASTFSWGSGLGTGDTKSVSPSTTTTYEVSGTGVNGCENTDHINVTVNPAITVTEVIITNSYTGNDGALQLTVSGGDLNYTFSWDNNEKTKDISGLAPGAYTVTITDGNGCTFQKTYNVGSVVGEEEEIIQSLNMYPNPIKNFLTIEVKGINFTYKIRNTLGQVMVNGQAQNSATINTSSFDAGVYFVQVKARGFEKSLRMLVKP